MKIASAHLDRFIDGLPRDPKELVALLDDVGIEVKNHADSPHGERLTVELLANRGDHYCYFGIARELGGRTGGALRFPAVALLDLDPAAKSVRIETALCARYSATLLEKVGDGALPAELLALLQSSGLEPLMPAIDATNLVNLEIGQPTHAFDADKVVGTIVVRTSRAGETCRPLFSTAPATLPEGTLVIADDVKILAVAGVIGCEDSKTTAETTRILVESAAFDPVAVRKASRALAVHTDASARFERGSDPTLVLVGAGRVVKLLEDHGGWRRVGKSVLKENAAVKWWETPNLRVIRLQVPLAAAYLAVTLRSEEVASRLARYGFASHRVSDEALDVVVPAHRQWDVEYDADLYEELAKSIGYNALPIAIAAVSQGSVPSPTEALKRRVEDVLVSQGFYEVFTDGFYGRDTLAKLGIDEGHALWPHVETLNALERDYGLLKNNALAHALDAVAKNTRWRVMDGKIYEWTRVFAPRPADIAALAGLPEDDPRRRSLSPATETSVLWGLSFGADRAPAWDNKSRPADIFFWKGLVAELSVALGREVSVVAGHDHPLAAMLHPQRRAVVLVDGKPAGVLGEVHPTVVKNHKLKGIRPVYFEVDAGILLAPTPRIPTYREPPTWSPVVRSLAFTLPGRVEAGAVAAHLQAAGPQNLDGVLITDRFDHEEGGQAVRTITFALSFANPDNSLTAEVVNSAAEALIASVHARFGDQGVHLR